MPDGGIGFIREFVTGRIAGFEKDIRICLTPVSSLTRRGNTHAYFPALAACCGLIEYLTVLYRGNINGIGWDDVARWAKRYLPQPDYNDDIIRVLFYAFRHPVAHRGIASGVWIDRQPGDGQGRRITWLIKADGRRPAIEVRAKREVLRKDPPWPCEITHRVHIHLKSLRANIKAGAQGYLADTVESKDLQDNFYACMRQLYPE